MTTTVDEFLSTTQIAGALTPEQAAQVLDLPQEGETAPVADLADAPAPAPAVPAAETTTTTNDKPEQEPEPAILAKDGKHLIPFEKLTEARESAQTAAAERDEALKRAAELQAQLDAAKQPQQPPNAEPEKIDLAALRRERANALLDGNVDKVIELEEKIDAEVQRAADEKAALRMKEEGAAATQAALMARVAEDARGKYPALDHTSDKADKEAIEFVVFKRDSLIVQGESPDKALAQAVESAAKLFKWSNGQPAETSEPKPDPKAAAAAAAAAIAAAKAPVPASLSAIPGGKPGGLSALEQLAGKASGPDLLQAMDGMSKTQIEEYLNRSL